MKGVLWTQSLSFEENESFQLQDYDSFSTFFDASLLGSSSAFKVSAAILSARNIIYADEREKRKVSLEVIYQVMSIKSSSESVIERLLLDLHEGNLNYIRRNKVIIKRIVRRLRQDLSMQSLFIETLKKSSDVNEKFVLLKLLVLGTGLGKELDDWVNKELERYKEDLPGVFGFDISTGNYISYYKGIRGLIKD